MPTWRPSESILVAELARIMAWSPSPMASLLDLTVSCIPTGSGHGAVGVLSFDEQDRAWSVVASTGTFEAEGVPAAIAGLAGRHNWYRPWERPRDGRAQDMFAPTALRVAGSSRAARSAIRLHGSGRLVGVLVLQGCSPAEWSDLPTPVTTGLSMCITGAVVRETIRANVGFEQRSARAIRRLFEEGAHAPDVAEAGEVLARVAADAFETERAGTYLVDTAGMVSFAVGIGMAADLPNNFAAALLGTVAAQSPIWQNLEQHARPILVDDTETSPIEPEPLVQTLGLTSYAAIPLLSKAGPLGMVICGDASRPRSWTPAEHDLAVKFALEGALIIEAARLRASERAQLAHITHQAFHDPLTGIPNRALLTERIEQALASAARRGSGTALILLDLNDFKQVNDTLGHSYGDQLLREVAKRLINTLRASDTVAHLGGDEFAILIPDDPDLSQARIVAAKVTELLSVPIDLDGIALHAVPSIGMAAFPDHARTAAELIQRADIAMHAAKRERSGTTVYHPSHDDSTVDKLTLYTQLREAITSADLRLVYQPKLDLRKNLITGVEALVRWQHPRRGYLSPAEFLPLAESTDLIDPLTEWVLSETLVEWARWRAQGRCLDLSVNMSVRNLLNRTLLSRVADTIRASPAADHLLLEVTETAVMIDPKETRRGLAALRTLGVRVSMDDFGAGYSSLTQLGQLPVDELKIDRQLVQGIAASELNNALVETIVALGHRLGLVVVAEGIETQSTLDVARQLGCDFAQGYLISRPVPGHELLTRIEHGLSHLGG